MLFRQKLPRDLRVCLLFLSDQTLADGNHNTDDDQRSSLDLMNHVTWYKYPVQTGKRNRMPVRPTRNNYLTWRKITG